MNEIVTTGLLLARNQEALYATQAPQMIARRELELLQAATAAPRQPRYGFRHTLARVSARLFGGTSSPAATS